jgi:uncharacterized membrane protein
MTLFIIGLVLFLGIHLFKVFAPGVRAGMIASMGVNAFRGVYSVAGIAALCLLIYGFGLARQDTSILYYPPPFLRHLTMLLMLIALIVLAAGFLPSGYIATFAKHPQVLAIKIWALAHLLVNGETVQVILFAAFLAWGVILRISYKRRARAGEISERTYKSWTYDVAAVLIGGAIYGLFVWKLHELLIGVPIVTG